MPLDAVLLSAVTRELEDRLAGGRIDKVQMPERDALLLSVRGQHAGRQCGEYAWQI